MNKDIEDCAKMLCRERCATMGETPCFEVGVGLASDCECGTLAEMTARFWLTREVTFEMMKAGSDAEESIELEKPRAFRARLVLNAMRRAQLAELGLDQTEKEKR